MQELGYKYIRFDTEHGQHLLLDTNTHTLEWWSASKNFAGFRIPYKNTHLEFCASADKNTAPF